MQSVSHKKCKNITSAYKRLKKASPVSNSTITLRGKTYKAFKNPNPMFNNVVWKCISNPKKANVKKSLEMGTKKRREIRKSRRTKVFDGEVVAKTRSTRDAPGGSYMDCEVFVDGEWIRISRLPGRRNKKGKPMFTKKIIGQRKPYELWSRDDIFVVGLPCKDGFEVTSIFSINDRYICNNHLKKAREIEKQLEGVSATKSSEDTTTYDTKEEFLFSMTRDVVTFGEEEEEFLIDSI